jgi:hypothetical protein
MMVKLYGRKGEFLRDGNHPTVAMSMNILDYPHSVSAGTNRLPGEYHLEGRRGILWHTTNTVLLQGLAAFPYRMNLWG